MVKFHMTIRACNSHYNVTYFPNFKQVEKKYIMTALIFKVLSIWRLVAWIFLLIYYIFNEKIATSIDQTAVPHNNIYLKKKNYHEQSVMCDKMCMNSNIFNKKQIPCLNQANWIKLFVSNNKRDIFHILKLNKCFVNWNKKFVSFNDMKSNKFCLI